MYYITIPVKADPGHESESIEDAIKHGMSKLVVEANTPLVLVNAVPVVVPDCLCLIIMAEKHEPPVRFSEIRGVQAVLDDVLRRNRS